MRKTGAIMSASLSLKIYSADGEYVASCKYCEDAAALVAMRGDGTTIRYGYSRQNIVWTEGKETQPAGESYDFVAKTISVRS
jgi:hypothetical protein